jgi:carboxymethylenebutenolidase
MGGRVSYLANTGLPLKAAISFYGGGIAPALLPRAPQSHGPVLFFWGGLDSHIPAEQIAAAIGAMKQAKKTYVNVEFSDADHGFFCDVRQSYKETAAKQAWDLSLRFLAIYVNS